MSENAEPWTQAGLDAEGRAYALEQRYGPEIPKIAIRAALEAHAAQAEAYAAAVAVERDDFRKQCQSAHESGNTWRGGRDAARAALAAAERERDEARGAMALVSQACGNADPQTAHHAVRRMAGELANVSADRDRLRGALADLITAAAQSWGEGSCEDPALQAARAALTPAAPVAGREHRCAVNGCETGEHCGMSAVATPPEPATGERCGCEYVGGSCRDCTPAPPDPLAALPEGWLEESIKAEHETRKAIAALTARVDDLERNEIGNRLATLSVEKYAARLVTLEADRDALVESVRVLAKWAGSEGRSVMADAIAARLAAKGGGA